MTINVSWYGPINDKNARYQALSADDKKFLLPEDLLRQVSLPNLMLATRIGFISDGTIPNLVGRIDVAYGGRFLPDMNDMVQKLGAKDLADYLARFLGVSVNVPTMTSTQYLTDVIGYMIPKLTSTDLKKMSAQAKRA
jgi:hypothetical protein